MDLHTNDSSESAAGVFVSDKCQIPVGGIPQQEPDRQQYYMALCRQKVQEISTNWASADLLYLDVRVSDECTRFRKASRYSAGKQDLWKEPVRNRFRPLQYMYSP